MNQCIFNHASPINFMCIKIGNDDTHLDYKLFIRQESRLIFYTLQASKRQFANKDTVYVRTHTPRGMATMNVYSYL